MHQPELIKQIVPADAAVLCHQRFNRRTVPFPRKLVREFFFPGNGKFFWDPGNSSSVNIPSNNWLGAIQV